VGFKIRVNEFLEGFVFEEDGVRVIPFRVNHHIGSDVPSYGFRVEYKDHSLVISGDTCSSENLVKYSENADLLIHEVAAAPLEEDVPEGIEMVLRHHTLPEECGRIFSKIRPRLAVYHHILQFLGVSLDEIMDRTSEVYDGLVVVGEDMMQIEIGESVQILNR
jgi:ribonuclease Z